MEQGKAFVERLRELAGRKEWEWAKCPWCGSDRTWKHGFYYRHPWTLLRGRKTVEIQRHRCRACGRTYAEEHPDLVRGSWYARHVHRFTVDQWLHMRTSLRRTAELMRSLIGRVERWLQWYPLEGEPEGRIPCHMSASTVHRWLDGAGREAQKSVKGQLEGIRCSGEMGSDGLWARMRGGGKRVVLMLVDSVTGVIWPPVVVKDEESASSWKELFKRAAAAGLDLSALNGLTSDGAQGLLSYLRESLSWVHQQRCVWHLWRNLGGKIARQVKMAVADLGEKEAQEARIRLKKELGKLVRDIFDAPSHEQGEQALKKLAGHPLGAPLAKFLNPLLDASLIHLMDDHQGLVRVSPEWCWRDFRQRLSRGKNHGSDQRLERAALVWAIYHNFTPAQRRSEQKRHYRHPGQCPLEVAGASPGTVSYLDALCV